jgi:hypothetical protein
MMNKRIVLLLALLSLSGCETLREALYGRENKLAPLGWATLGTTTQDEVTRLYGAPDEIDARRLEPSWQAEVYFYLDSRDTGNHRQYQFLACEFRLGILNAYSYHESAEPGIAGFNENARAGLLPGQSTRQDVEKRLGNPQGKALPPTTITLPALQIKLGGVPFPLAKLPEGGVEVWQYYQENVDEGRRKKAQQTLSVFFDAQGHYLADVLLLEASIKLP